MLKFVHAADLHLDSPLRGLSRYQGAPLQTLRGATRRALENLVQLCINEQAKLLLIAGDVYDGDWLDYNTGLFFNQQTARLERAGIRVVLVSGNHDAESKISRQLSTTANVSQLSTHCPETVKFDDLNIAVHGRGYARKAETDNLARGYPEPLDGWFNIGLLHTALDGREGHASYAPCRRDELISKNYDYWALGHVHRREEVCRDPWIIFPGNLQGRHVRETGPKGATVVSFDGDQISARHRDLDVLRWARLALDVSDAVSGDEILTLARDALDRARSDADGRALAVRLRLHGASPAYAELSSDAERWHNELRSAATEVGDELWLEKIHVDLQSPLDPSALVAGSDPLAGLLRTLSEVRDDPLACRALMTEFSASLRLPSEYRAHDDAWLPEDPKSWPSLLADAERLLFAQLLENREREREPRQ